MPFANVCGGREKLGLDIFENATLNTSPTATIVTAISHTRRSIRAL